MSDLTNRRADTDLADGQEHAVTTAEDSAAPLDAGDMLDEDDEHIPVDDISSVIIEGSDGEGTGASVLSVADAEDGADGEPPGALLAPTPPAPPSRVAPPIEADDFDEDRTLRPSRLPGGDWTAPAAVDPLQVQEDLRAEAEAAEGDPARVARLLAEIGESEEREGNESGAARDYLAAFNARPDFREPLEALLRVLDRRRSLKNLQKLTDALVRAAITPDERVRALVARAANQEDHEGDAAGALVGLTEALEPQETSAQVEELAAARLFLEVVAARTGDPASRSRALSARAADAGHPVWRALLQIDATLLVARAAGTTTGQLDDALARLEATLETAGAATYAVAIALEQAANHEGRAEVVPVDTDELRLRVRAYATALDVQAELIFAALTETGNATAGTSGDASGVPRTDRTPTHMVDAWLRAAEAHARSGDAETAAARLDRALEVVASTGAYPAEPVEPALLRTRIRLADRAGDTQKAAELAELGLHHEKDAKLAAALASRIASHALAAGDVARAQDALTRALDSDARAILARAMHFEIAGAALGTEDSNGTGGAPALAADLELLAADLTDEAAKARALLVAAYVHGAEAGNLVRARAALEQAKTYGTDPRTVSRFGRMLAALASDRPAYQAFTRSLVDEAKSDGAEDPAATTNEVSSLLFELVREGLVGARATEPDIAALLRELGAAPGGAWLARMLEAFLPGLTSGRRRWALEELAREATDPDLARGLTLVAAMRALAASDAEGAIRQLRTLHHDDPSDPLTTALLSDLERTAGDRPAAAKAIAAAASKVDDPELATALHLETGLTRWLEGDREIALESFEEAAIAGSAGGSGDGARLALAWASRGVSTPSVEARRQAIQRSLEAGGDPGTLSLERFAADVALGEDDAALESLRRVEGDGNFDLRLAAALARLVWPRGQTDLEAVRLATELLEQAGGEAKLVAVAEAARIARELDPETIVTTAERWVEAGGGLTASLEWLAGAMLVRDVDAELLARKKIASQLLEATGGSVAGPTEEAVIASATMLEAALHPERRHPFLDGSSHAVRLMNLELSPPGCDPARRSAALLDLDDALGTEAMVDGRMLAGWSELAAGEPAAALETFARAAHARPDDYGTWEGLRAAAEAIGDGTRLAFALDQLGTRTTSDTLAAELFEEAATAWQAAEDETRAEAALEASFSRDASRTTSFDRLFRRIRDRNERTERDHLLSLIDRRLFVADDPAEIAKLFWEQARALRDKSDLEAALKSLENVTMLEPEHVGALALTGEIALRRGKFEEAADSLAKLSKLDAAPPKNRITAGVTAVDLYENKLERHDLALEILTSLHSEGLTTLPVRERLARSAARNEDWDAATSILEELMNERPTKEGRIEAARLAMVIHRDRRKKPTAAVRSLAKLLDEVPTDPEALDLLLATELPAPLRDPLVLAAKEALRAELDAEVPTLPTARRLVRAARISRDEIRERAATGVSIALGEDDPTVLQTFARQLAGGARSPRTVLSTADIARIAAPGDSGPLAELLHLLGGTLADALGPSLAILGVGRRDKVDPRSGLQLRNEVAAWFGAFGGGEFDLYVGGKDTEAIVGVPGEVPVIVAGADVKAPLSPRVAQPARPRGLRDRPRNVAGALARRHNHRRRRRRRVPHRRRERIEAPAYAMLADVEKQMKQGHLAQDEEAASRMSPGRWPAERGEGGQPRLCAPGARLASPHGAGGDRRRARRHQRHDRRAGDAPGAARRRTRRRDRAASLRALPDLPRAAPGARTGDAAMSDAKKPSGGRRPSRSTSTISTGTPRSPSGSRTPSSLRSR